MLSRFFLVLAAFSCSLSLHGASALKDVELRDLYFGEIIYYAYQDMPFEALSKLDAELSQFYGVDESELDPFNYHRGQAEFSVGDLELQYRMSKRAGQAIKAVLGEGIDLAIRNQAALALARVFYKKNEPQGALYALGLIREEPEKSRYEKKYSLDILKGKPRQTFKEEVAYLRGLASIQTGQFKQAVELLKPLKKEKLFKGYILYNLAIALMQSGDEQQGLQLLTELGNKTFSDKGLLALKDKTNLKLAYIYLDKAEGNKAKAYFERVRLKGPYSNSALLGAGWVSVAQGRFDRALVPWSILHKRDETNYSVQEVLMAVPYAYSQLKAYGNAANAYKHAMDVFATEVESLDSSIRSIRKGRFLDALLDKQSDKDSNWVVNLRNLPDTPETRYILELMAAHDFQESYKNYKDLAGLRHHITKWLDDLRVYEEMIEIRRAYQQPLLPVVEKEFVKLDGRIKLRLEQRENLANKLKNMLIAPRPEYLATSTERQAMDIIAAIDEIRATNPTLVSTAVVEKVNHTRGIISWKIHSEYDQRLTVAYNHLVSLDEFIQKLKIVYNSFVRTRQAATQSYEGYTIPIRQLRTRLFAAQRTLKGVMAKQGRMIETMAINELEKPRKRLEEYQIKARFALAESYDRATKSKLDDEIARQSAINADATDPKEGDIKDGKTEEGEAEAEAEGNNNEGSEDKPDVEDSSKAEPEPDAGQSNSGLSFKQKLLSR
jgi:Flp pilus assembly protein TadD